MPNYSIIVLEYRFFSVFKTECGFFSAVKAECDISFNWNDNYSRLDAVNNTAGYSNTISLNTTVISVYLRFSLKYSFIFRSFNKSHWEYLRYNF